MARARNLKSSSMAENPSQIFHFLSLSPISLLFSPHPKPPKLPKLISSSSSSSSSSPSSPSSFSVLFFFLLAFICFSLPIILSPRSSDTPCTFTSHASPLAHFSLAKVSDNRPSLPMTEMDPLPAHGAQGNASIVEREFWRQPDGEGYRPCLEFGIEYRKESAVVAKERRRFLVVVVSGGLNQQRNQIVDAVVIARILKAALVVPVLQVNLIWGDESEFSDIFDVEHFKRTLQADVRIVSSLPSTHLVSRQTVETQIPFDVTPLWIRTRFSKQLNEEGLIVLKGLDSKLSKNLPPDLQKLRCKVAFHALQFAPPILELGSRLARRMWIEGPYIAIHLRLEKDVWVRTGCLTGLGREYDDKISKERSMRPEYLTGRVNMSYSERRLAGLCPLNAFEVARLLKALGAPGNARVYVAGGEPYGGSRAIKPLLDEFPNLMTKEMLVRGGELLPFANRSSALAALDYIVSLSGDVFLPSHGGNMGRAMQGHRAYSGHRKFIKPNKRMMLPFFEDASISEDEFGSIIRKLHEKSQGQPESRTGKRGRNRHRDVIAYPVPECMCRHQSGLFHAKTMY